MRITTWFGLAQKAGAEAAFQVRWLMWASATTAIQRFAAEVTL